MHMQAQKLLYQKTKNELKSVKAQNKHLSAELEACKKSALNSTNGRVEAERRKAELVNVKAALQEALEEKAMKEKKELKQSKKKKE